MKIDIKKAVIAAVGGALMFATGFGGATYLVVNKTKAEIKAQQEQLAAEKEKEKQISQTEGKEGEPSSEFGNLKKVAEELEIWKSELSSQKTKQMTMDQELLKREQVLKAEREALDQEKTRVTEMQKELNSKILMVQSAETTNYKDLAATFSKMKVDQVVIFLRMFSDDQTSKLMSFLPRKQLVKVLEQWSTAYPDDRERLMQVTSQIRRVIVEPLAQNTNNADNTQGPEIQTQ